jgi:hypothetical protein
MKTCQGFQEEIAITPRRTVFRQCFVTTLAIGTFYHYNNDYRPSPSSCQENSVF